MKVIIVCLVLFLVAVVTPFTQEQKQKLAPYSKQCKPESGVSDDLIKRARDGDIADDIRLKKQILCIMKKLGFLNGAGEIVLGKFKESIKKVAANDAETERIVKKCIVKHDTPEDTVFKIGKCLLGTNKKWSPV